MVRHSRKTDRSQEHCMVVANLLQPVLRHHPPVLQVIFAAPRQLVPLEGQAELCGGCLKHPDALRHYLFADAVACNHCDLMMCHPSDSVSALPDPPACFVHRFSRCCREGEQLRATAQVRAENESQRPVILDRPCHGSRGLAGAGDNGASVWRRREVASDDAGRRGFRNLGIEHAAQNLRGCGTALMATPLSCVSPRTRRRTR